MPIMAVGLIMIRMFAYILPVTKDELMEDKKRECDYGIESSCRDEK